MNNVKTITIQYLARPEEYDTSKQLTAGKFLFPGFTYEFTVAGKQLPNGKFRYITGLEVSKDADNYEEIVEAKKMLEGYFGEGSLEPTNEEFWKEIKLTLNKKTTFLDIENNPTDALTYYLIKGGGIPEIASSYEQAISSDKAMRWFMVEPSEQADIVAVDDRMMNKAIACLTDLDENKSLDDMMLVHKNLISTDRGITRQTPKSTIYTDLSMFIKGQIVKTDRKLTPKQFVEVYNDLVKNKKKLYITACVKDAIYFNFLVKNQEDEYINFETKVKYGATLESIIKKLSSPNMQDELENIKNKVEEKWSK